MSNRPSLRKRSSTRRARARNRRRHTRVAVVVTGVVVVGITVGLGVGLGGTSGGTGSDDSSGPLAPTGETNDMGMPVVSTPGSASGTAAAGGLEVVGADWDLGQVPIDVAVRPTWALRNTTGATVTVGEPRAEVREGCCPGPLTVDDPTLAPGESTTLTFELAMHEGMDGPHDLGVYVPVGGEGEPAELALSVVGDFGA